jgi:tRNA(Ile)-lysidine synthase
MISPGDIILAGVSGGPDSVALLHLLNRLKDELQFGLYAGHLNHMFRGEEAAADARLVQNLAREWNIPLVAECINVPAYIKESGLSPQQGAREVRYRFFEETAARIGANRVALGHHADDVAETVLLNLLRGAGMTGLSGIPPVRDGVYIRPLLEMRRKEIESYCREFDLPYRVDRSNLKLIYLRNRLRLELIPFLEQNYNPALVDSLNRMAEIIRDEDDYLNGVARRALAEVIVKPGAAGKIVISLEKMAAYPIAVRRRLLRLAYRELAGFSGTPAFEHIGRALEMAAGKAGRGKMDLPGGILLVKRRRFLEIIKNRKHSQTPFYQYCMQIPGATRIPEVNRTIQAEIREVSAIGDPRQFCLNEAVLDYESLKGPVCVRRRKNGDTFWPLGMGGKTKLKKFFIDLKVPEEKRDAIPLVTCGNAIVWVAGFRPGEPWKVTASTRSCLLLRLREDPGGGGGM